MTVESALCQKHAFIKKFTIFTRSLWNFDKRRSTRGPPFVKVLLWSGKNCEFSNKSMFLTKCGFYCHTVYRAADRRALGLAYMSLHIWKFVTRILAYISSACHTRPSSAKCQARPIFYRPIAAALAFKLSIVSNKWGQHISKSWITIKRMKHLYTCKYKLDLDGLYLK